MVKQREIFTKSEGDAFYQRNQHAMSIEHAGIDPLFHAVAAEADVSFLRSLKTDGEVPQILEIGCANGWRLAACEMMMVGELYGIEPSEQAVSVAPPNCRIYRGDATNYPAEIKSHPGFDIILFGFMLYLVDRDEILTVIENAHRKLKKGGWLGIYDFYSETPKKVPYKHHDGVFSYHDDYSRHYIEKLGYKCLRKTIIETPSTTEGVFILEKPL